MKFIIGLGNPSSEYTDTWHNTGLLFVDNFPKIWGITTLKSNKFMNNSGEFVEEAVKKNNIDLQNLYIAHDDLDLALGSFKIQFGKGPKDHNGLKSIDGALGTDKYWHVRIGVDNRPADNRIPGEEYVLQRYSDSEKQILENTIKAACKKLIQIIDESH